MPAASGSRSRSIRMRSTTARTRSTATSCAGWVRRLSRPLPGQHADVQGRGARLPRRQLLPRARPGPALRPLGARPGDRHRREQRRGVSAVRRVLDRAPRGRARRSSTIYALLDSPRATGAYRFVLKPGVDDRARRRRHGCSSARTSRKLGLAPLTSMFFFGANQRPAREDYRPQVHDSDGLSIQASTTEWIWRPLVNPKRLLVTSFALTDPAGLRPDAARALRSAHYEDLEARYDLRPSAWVEPKGSWGPGRVELVQIPVPDETNDNIVAYWVPRRQPKPKQPLDVRVSRAVAEGPEMRPPIGRVRADASRPRLREVGGRQRRASRRLRGAGADADAGRGHGRRRALGRHERRDPGTTRRCATRSPAAGAWSCGSAASTAASRWSCAPTCTTSNEVVSETWSYILPPE